MNTVTMISSVFLLGLTTTDVTAFSLITNRANSKASPFASSSIVTPSSLLSTRYYQKTTPSSTPLSSTSLLSTTVTNDATEDLNLLETYFGRPKLPPPPEDTIVLTGDLASLFVYGFLDHFICADVANWMLFRASSDTTDGLSPAQHLHELAIAVLPDEEMKAQALAIPVWLEGVTHVPSASSAASGAAAPSSSWVADHALMTLVSDQTVAHYSPLLQPTGLATILLATTWLLAGWWHSAFAFHNTLEAKPEHHLAVTAKTWLTSCGLLTSLVAVSHLVCGCPLESFTKGDMDYILGSLTVLIMWRFMASSLLGYWSEDD